MKFILPNPFLYCYYLYYIANSDQTAIYFLHILKNILIPVPVHSVLLRLCLRVPTS